MSGQFHQVFPPLCLFHQDALPKWKDPGDILAMLRVCNYNPDECIGTYLHLEGDGRFSVSLNLMP